MKRLIALFILLNFCFGLFAAKVSVSPVKTSYNEIYTDENGNLVQTVYSDNGMEITIGSVVENEKLKYNIQLSNVKDLSFLKRTNSIKTYYGNMDTDTWTENTDSAINQTSISINNSNNQTNESISPEEACVIAGTTCLCALTLYEICNSSSSKTVVSRNSSTTRRAATRKPSVKRSTTSRMPSFSWIIIDPIINIETNSSSNRRAVPNNQIIPSDNDFISNENLQYAGTFILPLTKAPDFRLRIIVSDNEFIDFYFSRSDRNQLANPLKDRNYGRHSLAFSANVPQFNRFGGYYIYSGKKIGCYFGTTMHIESIDEEPIADYSKDNIDDIEFNSNFDYPTGIRKNDVEELRLGHIYNEPKLIDYYNFNAGLTIKTFPYTWLMLGCGVEFINKLTYRDVEGYVVDEWKTLGTGYVLSSLNEVHPVPQLGVNFIIGNLDLATMFNYSFINGPSFDLMIGIAF